MSFKGPLQYALVAYIQNELGEFVRELRRDIHPAQAHLTTHITVLPPRPLQGSETEAIAMLQQAGTQVSPFEVELDQVESFLPVTPTIFIRVCYAGYRMRELHDLMNCAPLAYQEPLLYMPHVTVAKLDDNERAARALQCCKQRWADWPGSHRFRVDKLSFVRGQFHSWIDLAEIPLTAPRR